MAYVAVCISRTRFFGKPDNSNAANRTETYPPSPNLLPTPHRSFTSAQHEGVVRARLPHAREVPQREPVGRQQAHLARTPPEDVARHRLRQVGVAARRDAVPADRHQGAVRAAVAGRRRRAERAPARRLPLVVVVEGDRLEVRRGGEAAIRHAGQRAVAVRQACVQ